MPREKIQAWIERIMIHIEEVIGWKVDVNIKKAGLKANPKTEYIS